MVVGILRRHPLPCALAVLLAALAAWRLWPDGLNRWPMANPAVAPDAPLIAFGDSLVAGVGASSARAAYPALLGETLGRQVVVHGHPGATAGEARRLLAGLPPRLEGHLVVVTLGGNDLLQRIPWSRTEEDLRAVFQELQDRGALVAFTGVESPLFGGDVAAGHRRLCRESGVILVPDALAGITANPALRADAVHPNDAGCRKMADRVAAVLRRFL